jgi:cytochrome P450 family 4
VLDEIQSISSEKGKLDLSMEDLGRLKYLDMCWKEAMRLQPPIPMFGRKLTEDIVLGKGKVFVKLINLLIPQRYENNFFTIR